MSRPKDEISEEESQEISTIVNDNHPAALYALALEYVNLSKDRKGFKVSFVKLESVSLNGFRLTYVECEPSLMCRLQSADLPFNPPLKHKDEALMRFEQESQRVLSPQLSWMVTDCVMGVAFLLVATLGFVTFVGGEASVNWFLDRVPMRNGLLLSVFGSVKSLMAVVHGSFYFAVVVHALEAVYLLHELTAYTNLSAPARAKWMLLVCCSGYPVTKRGLELINVAKLHKSSKNA